MILNSLLYLQEVQMTYVNAYRDLPRKLYSYIDQSVFFPLGICLSI